MSTTNTGLPASNESESFGRMPHDELLRYGRSLGLELTDDLNSDELVERVRRRRELLESLEREGLLEVIRWSRRAVRENAAKEELAREISTVDKTNYESLSRRALVTLARLREIEPSETDTADQIIDKLRKRESFWQRFHRGRRRVVGSLLSRIIDGDSSKTPQEYQYLPEEVGPVKPDDKPAGLEPTRGSLRRQIEDLGVVGGLAQRLRGAADDYIKVKLDEIEARIDQKLNEIDQRLAEWRDREVANRLRILRITLAFTVVVAVLSLVYNYTKQKVETRSDTPAAVEKVDDPSAGQ